ncbi:MAG: hypothetical protein LBT50_11085 [Prevotellaceae bacterium]|nr:hypothetical protein [Prevotellaceae bacterium]
MKNTGKTCIFVKENKVVVNEKNIINEKGEIDYGQLKRTADAVESGYSRINRLSLAEEQGRTKGGRRNVEASLILAADRRANRGRQESYERQKLIDRQENLLKQYATDNNLWIPEKEIADKAVRQLPSGYESHVYLGKDEYVTKFVKYRILDNTPEGFIDNRISLYNYVFPDTYYELVGFSETGDNFEFVVRQPFIQGRHLDFNNESDVKLLDAEMEKIGFKQLVPTVYKNDNIGLYDFRNGNVIIDSDGNILFIDIVPKLNMPSPLGGVRDYGSGGIIENIEEKNEENDRRTEKYSPLQKLVGEQREMQGIHQTIAEATSNSSGSIGRSTSKRRTGWNKERFLGQLEIEALKNNTWIDGIYNIADEAISKGQENEVYLSKDGMNVIKANNLSLLDDEHDFDSFIDRLNSHNDLFPEVGYRIIGFVENSMCEVSVALEQPYVMGGRKATREQIDNYLLDKGFRKTKLSDGFSGWANGKYELWDVEPRNVLIDKRENLYFIDTVVNSIKEM